MQPGDYLQGLRTIPLAAIKSLRLMSLACLCLPVLLSSNSFAADSGEILRTAREAARGWKSYTCDYKYEDFKAEVTITNTGTISFLRPAHRRIQSVSEAITGPGVEQVKQVRVLGLEVSDGETKFAEVRFEESSRPNVFHVRESHGELAIEPSQMIEELTVLFDLKADDAATTRTLDGMHMEVLSGAYNPDHSIEDDSVATRKQFLEGDLSQLGWMYKSATVWIGRDDHMIHRVDLARRYPPAQTVRRHGENEHITINFSAMKINPPLTPADFMYVPPEGVTVEDQTGSPAK